MFSRIIALALCSVLLMPGGNLMAQKAPQPATQAAVQEQAPSPMAANGPELLTQEEEQALGQRSEEPGREVAGGALSTQQLTYIVIALAAAVLVLIFK